MVKLLRRREMMQAGGSLDESQYFRWYRTAGSEKKYWDADTTFDPQVVFVYSEYAMTATATGKWTSTTIPLGMIDSTCGGARGDASSTTDAGGYIHVGSLSGKRYTSGSGSRTFKNAYTFRCIAVSADAFTADLPNFWSTAVAADTNAGSITIDPPFDPDVIILYDTTALSDGVVPSVSGRYFVRVVDNSLLSSMNIRTRNTSGGVSMYLVGLNAAETRTITFGCVAGHTYRVICIKGEPD